MTAGDRRAELRKQLEETLDEANWGLLRAHAARDGLILVAAGLDLLEAALRIAENDETRVSDWIDAGLLFKPSAEQLKAWEKCPDKKFLSVVVQPYVLAQEHLVH